MEARRNILDSYKLKIHLEINYYLVRRQIDIIEATNDIELEIYKDI